MKKTSKRRPLQQWASQITALRERLKINQAELARRMECSAMTISRWERGLLQPSAEHFVQLGNLGSKNEAWFFWEMAGIQASKMLEALRTTSHHGLWLDVPQLEQASAGAKALHPQKKTQLVGLPCSKRLSALTAFRAISALAFGLFPPLISSALLRPGALTPRIPVCFASRDIPWNL